MHVPGVRSLWKGLLVTLLLTNRANAIDLDVTDQDSLKNAASTSVYAMMTYYHGNETGQIPGAFPTKWWEGAALFLALLHYWHFTGDTTYNDELSVGLEWQAGECDYMPSNYSAYLGNDDQMFWGLAAMTAAEIQFPDSTVGEGYSWLSLAQGVFNTQIARWDTTKCGGGLRWQIWSWESGYTMKNAISNGGLFQLSARLYRYTGSETYGNWARKIWDWSVSSPLVSNSTWNVADSTEMTNDCTTQGNTQWSYNYGTYLIGASYMYNSPLETANPIALYQTNGTEQATWKTAVSGLLNQTLDKFAPASNGGILEEIVCEPSEVCNNNEVLFKGLVSGWLSFTALVAPFTFDTILPKLQTSAQAAAKSCTGHNNNTCGVRWYQSNYDGWIGMEEQISATNIFVANLINFETSAPVTSTTGGNSTGNPTAGTNDTHSSTDNLPTITTADKAGAGILAVVFVIGWVGLMGWTVMGG
ncbi:Mannan endo-1-6-alpha-mannosidase DCW1 [Penicillium maclennaniae]|uniref:Mannan endo-1-6-alpha-mannosidase DCW1 n=1 Tax=Penicillium maclennaniae TaxID=1343394 RepID=UPI002540E01A|nr:Mannan endo-1-6-alpha-mannosidase DCW1 [Penicillium maclennaniae]KAJ5681603.1 Mannan endo-1-6-alpha-mannosidase DCW1 [Penicillium maclennaniae]